MHRLLCLVTASVAALAVAGCNGDVGSSSMPSAPAATTPANGTAPSSGASSGSGGGSGSSSGSVSSSGSGGSGSSGGIPIPIAPGITIAVASSWAALTAGQYATAFDVTQTDDLLVVVKVGPAYEGVELALNFQSPSGGTLVGTKMIVANGEARFNVKLGGTVVGRSAQTGVFPLVLGDMRTQQEIGRTSITLVKGGAQ